MQKKETSLKDCIVLEPTVFGDDRGFFLEAYNEETLKSLGIDFSVKQANLSRSAKGVLRGLHFQLPPQPMAKLVRVVKGKIFDVAVDLRKASPTYLKWFGVELSDENKLALLVPEGFAHGFYTLEDADVFYLTSHVFNKELDGGIAYNDASVNIEWPLFGEPTLSARDSVAPSLADLDLPF